MTPSVETQQGLGWAGPAIRGRALGNARGSASQPHRFALRRQRRDDIGAAEDAEGEGGIDFVLEAGLDFRALQGVFQLVAVDAQIAANFKDGFRR